MPSTFWARTDSGTANNPSLNLTGDSALEITFVASGTNGDLFLEQPTGGGIDPDTQISINGVTYDFTFEFTGDLPTQNNQGAGKVPDQYEGSAVNVITVQDYPSAGDTTRLVFMPGETATQAEMDSFGNGAISPNNVDTTPPPSPVCFAQGTLILTPRGEIPVEALRAGDLVITLDDGALPILWISKSKHSWPLDTNKSKPISIAAGALGPNIPARDLVVSPQHKMLLSGAQVRALFGEDQVLAPAKGLVSLPGVRIMKGKREVVYYHILIARHSVLISDGAPSESFYPGPSAMEMLERHQRDAVFSLFPKLESDPQAGYGPKARRCLSCRESETLVSALNNPNSLVLAA